MESVFVAGTGATILLFALTYEHMKRKKGHTSNDNEGLIVVMYMGTLVLLFVATKEYLRLKGHK